MDKIFFDFIEPLKEIKTILCKLHLKVATAESCTGGLLGAVFSSIAGSSSFFEGCIVTYSNNQKINLLKIKKTILQNFGAVSKECSEAMAISVKNITDTNIGISVTGIAGPDGGTIEKPVGTVFSTIAFNTSTKTFKFSFSGNRNEIRMKTVYKILENLSKELNSF